MINEYCEPCEAIVNGMRREVPALEELEEFSFDSVIYRSVQYIEGTGDLVRDP